MDKSRVARWLERGQISEEVKSQGKSDIHSLSHLMHQESGCSRCSGNRHSWDIKRPRMSSGFVE